MNKKAFTLTEILLAIAIIGALLAIAVPIYQNARREARRASCFNNLRQIGLAIQYYVDDHDGAFPPGGGGEGDSGIFIPTTTWEAQLDTYVDDEEELFVCPEPPPPYEGTGSYAPQAYGYNGDLGGAVSGTPKRLSHVPNVSQVILCADGIPQGTSGVSLNNQFTIHYRHNGGACVVTVDGNVRYIRPADIGNVVVW